MTLERAVRRRGQELEDAILEAAWAQLVEGGYGNFTVDAVAERAQTSRSVIYRRWPERDDLVSTAIAFGLRRSRIEPPDTGSLREDTIELLRRSSASRSQLAPLLSVMIGTHFSETGVSFADIRAQMIGGGRTHGAMDDIIERAIARGEIDPARLTPRVRTVAFDLFRHDLLMTLKPLPDQAIIEIVDEIFLPLVRPLP